MINKKFGRSVVVPSGESNAVNNTPAAPVAPMTAVQAPSQQHIPTSNTILVEHENFDFPGSVPAILNDVVIPVRKGSHLSSQMEAPHPALQHYQWIGCHELVHPTYLKHPNKSDIMQSSGDGGQLLNSLYKSPPWQLGLASVKEQSYTPYLASFCSIWNVYSWQLMQIADDTSPIYLPSAEVKGQQFILSVQHCLEFIPKDSLAAFRSHIHFYMDLGLLPDLRRSFLKRLLQAGSNLALDSSKDLEHRLVFPPMVVARICTQPYFHCKHLAGTLSTATFDFKNDSLSLGPLTQEVFLDLCVMLGFASGHHCGESYSFCYDQLSLSSHTVVIKPFKFYKGTGDEGKIATPLLVAVGSYVQVYYPTVFAHAQPATMFFTSERDFNKAINAHISGKMVQAGYSTEGFSEGWTHRILRRTSATIQHYMGLPVDAICYFLNDQTRSASKNYVARLNQDAVDELKANSEFFNMFLLKAEHCPDGGIDQELDNLLHPEPAKFMFKQKPVAVSPSTVAKNIVPPKKRRLSGSNQPSKQPVITAWLKK